MMMRIYPKFMIDSLIWVACGLCDEDEDNDNATDDNNNATPLES